MKKDYEKLIILFEMQGINVSQFTQLKKNELLVEGSKEINETITFENLVQEQYQYIDSENGYTNPFFMQLGTTEHVDTVEDITIYHYKQKRNQTIYEVLLDEDLMETQKHDVVYRGFQQLCNEYKLVLDNTAKSDIAFIASHMKMAEANDDVITPRWLKKGNKRFWLLGIVFIVFNVIFIKDSYITDKPLFVFLFNTVFNLLILFPFIKLSYYFYLLKERQRQYKALNAFKAVYETIMEQTDEHIEKLEKDIYRYYSDPSKKGSIKYLKKTNIKLKRVRKIMNQIMRRNTNQSVKKVIKKTIKTVHLVAPISAIGLMILFFIIR